MQVTVKQGQNIFDIAIQTAGSVSAAFATAILNGIGITEDLVVGDVLMVAAATDKRMLQHYRDAGIVPATATGSSFFPGQEGVGYWIIGSDFVIS